jgi:hypothetical protein
VEAVGMTAIALPARTLDVAFLRRAAWVTLTLGGLIPLAWLLTAPGHGFDFYAYWGLDLARPYATIEGSGAFHYPPPFVLLFFPLRVMPFEVGYWLWTAMGFGVLVYLTGRWALAWLLFPPLTLELYYGNVRLLIALGLVVGLQASAAWAPVAIVKVTSGVVVLWHAFRGSWRAMGIVLASCALICLPTVLFTPGLWTQWWAHVMTRAAQDSQWGTGIAIPLWYHVGLAVLLTAYAARTNRPVLLAPAIALAMPVLWIQSLALLVAVPRLSRR